MWGLMLKYCLEVQGRPHGDVVIFASLRFMAGARGASLRFPLAWPASLIVTLPLVCVVRG
jgi:hypothetical protein